MYSSYVYINSIAAESCQIGSTRSFVHYTDLPYGLIASMIMNLHSCKVDLVLLLGFF